MVIGLSVVMATGCMVLPSDSGDSQVESNMSMRQAQHTIYDYFNQTLIELPSDIRLSRKPASDQLGAFTKRKPNALPCWDGSIQSHGPRRVDIAYWIVGIPPGGTGEYFQRISDIWIAKGWEQTDRDSSYVSVRTDDGFGLALEDASKGDGSLSLTGFSPCVPEETKDSLEDLPEVFPHP